MDNSFLKNDCEFSASEIEERKKAIFDTMSERGRKRILKKGYEDWDPFIAPKDPIDIRTDKTQRTTQDLVRMFLRRCPADRYSNAYGQGVFDMCHGIINNDDRIIAMFEFSQWYAELLKAEGCGDE